MANDLSLRLGDLPLASGHSWPRAYYTRYGPAGDAAFGYNRALPGLSLSAGHMAGLIPPSIAMVLFAMADVRTCL